MNTSVDYGLYYILDMPSDRDPAWLVHEAAEGGATVVQVRGKDLSSRQLYETTVLARKVLAGSGVPLIVDDRVDIALAAGADGVHVGNDDLPFEQVRQLAPNLLLGVSCYADMALAERASRGGADYVAFGAFYPSPTKPDAQLAPMEILTEAQVLGVPIVAIGGIGQETAAEIVRLGAGGVSVISAIQGAVNPRAAAAKLCAEVKSARAQTRQASGCERL